MITEELLKYIENERKSGKDDARIRATLVAEGWSEEDLNEGFEHINFIKNTHSVLFNFSFFYLVCNMFIFGANNFYQINQIYFLSIFLILSIIFFYLVNAFLKLRLFFLNLFFILYFILSTIYILFNALKPAASFIGISETIGGFFVIGALIFVFVPLFYVSILGIFKLNSTFKYLYQKTILQFLKMEYFKKIFKYIFFIFLLPFLFIFLSLLL